MPITVSIIEDDRGTREQLLAVLGCDGGLKCLKSYESGEEALPGLLKETPQVVLMDIKLRGMSGIQCVAQLKARLPQVQVLMLTTYEDTDLIFESLRAGASGYLLKNRPPSEVIQAVKRVQAGDSPMSAHIARKVVSYFQRFKQPSSDMDKLSAREMEILALLAKGYLYKEIASLLSISANTVRVHVHAIYQKLHVHTRSHATMKFWER